jgi:hypothetical protein
MTGHESGDSSHGKCCAPEDRADTLLMPLWDVAGAAVAGRDNPHDHAS